MSYAIYLRKRVVPDLLIFAAREYPERRWEVY